MRMCLLGCVLIMLSVLIIVWFDLGFSSVLLLLNSDMLLSEMIVGGGVGGL